jgi:hypothetical protein
MRKLAESEVLSLRELLQMETHALEKAKLVQPIAKDQHVQELISSGISAGEARIRGIQQFISENEILEPGEVH